MVSLIAPRNLALRFATVQTSALFLAVATFLLWHNQVPSFHAHSGSSKTCTKHRGTGPHPPCHSVPSRPVSHPSSLRRHRPPDPPVQQWLFARDQGPARYSHHPARCNCTPHFNTRHPNSPTWTSSAEHDPPSGSRSMDVSPDLHPLGILDTLAGVSDTEAVRM